ncbi:MAG: restriction endonuclease [Thermoleophilia bacterium]
MSTGSTTARGRELERVVARLFTAHGYDVRCNEIVTGRSGARHEIDVLASRPGALTRSEVAVECKHWRAPVDGQVVARAGWMREDLGLTEVIVVCPGGAAPAARTAARAVGVALWDGPELRRRLGDDAVAALARPGEAPTALGLPRAVGGARAASAVRSRARGLLGALTERIEWVEDLWLPAQLLGLDVTRPHGRRGALECTRTWILHEALGGVALQATPDRPAFAEVDVTEPVVPPALSAERIAENITRALRRRDAVTQEAARRRHTDALEAGLVPGDAVEVTVVAHHALLIPVTVACVRRGETSRAVTLDGATGHVGEPLSARCTAHLAAIAEAVERNAPDGG